jgi:hypothetical protein
MIQRFNSIKCFALIIMLGCIGCAQAMALGITEHAQRMPWTTDHSVAMRKLFINTAAVQDFVNHFVGSEAVPAKVGEYRLVDMNGDGQLELMVTIDYSGRNFYTNIVLFSKHDGRIAFTQVSSEGANIDNLDSHIVDIDHDGHKELLVPRLLSPYQGAEPTAMFTDIYTYQDGHLVQSDKRFVNYYLNHRLPQLQARMTQLRNGHATSGAASQKLQEALQKEIDAIHRMMAQ